MILSRNKRTILKSRIRAHPRCDQQILILRLPASLSDMSKTNLVALALGLGIDCPTDAADAAYTAARSVGAGHAQAMQAADAVDYRPMASTPAGNAHLRAYGACTTTPDAGIGVDADADADTDADADADTDADTDTCTVTPDTDTVTPDTDAQLDADIATAVSNVLAPMGQGDLTTFQSRLRDLARKAVTPPPAPIYVPAAYVVDPAKVRGTTPQVIRHKATLQDVKIEAPALPNPTAAALDVYDAPDAPTLDPNYLWPAQQTAEIVALLARGKNVFLTGPAGTGKTTFAQQIAARFGRPFVRISCDDQTEGATLTGMTVPNPDTGATFQDGQLTAAIRRPGTVILIDEPSVARPGALMVMQAVLDDGRALTIQETGERVPVAPGVMFIIADNTNGTGDETGAYEGTRRLNAAFLDRFAGVFDFDYLPPAKEARAIATATGLSSGHAMILAKFGALTRTGAIKGEVSRALGIRRLIALGHMIASSADPARAFHAAVIAGAPSEDREPLRQMWTAHAAQGAFQ